jgi:hypothetical protein
MLRFLACVFGLAAQGYSFLAAFRSGYGWGGDNQLDAYTIGVAFSLGLVGSSLVCGPATMYFASNRAWFRALGFAVLWIGLTAVVMANSTGYIATHRGDTVADKQKAIATYEQALADIERLNNEIRAADAKGKDNRSEKLQQRLQEAQRIRDAGRPGSSDAGAETLSWMTGGAIGGASVARAQSPAASIALELAANGMFLLAFGSRRPEAPRRKLKRRSKRSSRRRTPPAPAVEKRAPEGTIDLDEKRAQRAVAHWAPR